MLTIRAVVAEHRRAIIIAAEAAFWATLLVASPRLSSVIAGWL